MKISRIFDHAARAMVIMAMSLAFTLTAFAADGQITFSDPSAQSGTQVNVTLKISADEGTRLADATLTLQYPQDGLEFVSGTDASGGAGTIRVHGVTNGAGSSELQYNLVFNTSKAGSYTINVDTYEVYDEDGAALNITHVGSSAVTVAAAEELSQNADLGSLELSPGSLEPAFDPAVTTYSTTIGASVDQLGINALTADPGASVIIRNNEALPMGQSTVLVTVTAPDGQTVKDYVINVDKVEGGPEAPVSDAEAQQPDTVEGVQLSSRGKTITIMNPGADVEIPEGFTDAIITIDGQRVQGWFWGADTDPEYCVVYGMNDRGELNFYRYDLEEKTLQRYFSDPLSADAVSNAEYDQLQESYNSLSSAYELRFAVICVLCIICAALLIAVIVLSRRLSGAERERRSMRSMERRRSMKEEQPARSAEPEKPVEEILSHDYDMGSEEEQQDDMDETQVISELSSGRSREESKAEPAPEAGKEISDKDSAAKDDTFESFDI